MGLDVFLSGTPDPVPHGVVLIAFLQLLRNLLEEPPQNPLRRFRLRHGLRQAVHGVITVGDGLVLLLPGDPVAGPVMGVADGVEGLAAFVPVEDRQQAAPGVVAVACGRSAGPGQ